jgi:2-keto-4-pentenoate hydratase/2-oxohepta-3-ene-1,7-dioic acid hydratase in catechol pathway
MKWCRFQNGDKASYGIIEGDNVTEVEGSPFESHTRTSNTVPLSSVKLLTPVIPSTFYAAGINFREHVTEMAAKRGEEPQFPPAADVGYRANNALCADGDDIVMPKDAGELFQYEGELVAVIGKQCRHVSEDQALDYVFGYTIGNDVSERTWQRGDRTLWRGKNCDTFKPMGPWIETEGVDPEHAEVRIVLNGKFVSKYNMDGAIFSLKHYISRMSTYMTLYPGDVIWMGTDGAPENMVEGDVINIEIDGIGTLSNPVVRGK